MKKLQSGSRRRSISQARSRVAQELVVVHGVPMAQIAGEVGVSTSAISKIISRTKR